MDINVNIGGPLADAINNLAQALLAGAKAEQVVSAAKASSRGKKSTEPAAEAPKDDKPQASAPTESASSPSTPAGGDTPLTAAQAADALKGHANKDDDQGNAQPATTQAAAEPAVKAEPATASPSDKKEIKVEDVRAKLAGLSKAGKGEEVRALLVKFEAPSVSALKPEQYAEILAAAEAL